mgnify:CR=1 FL=1
MVKVDIEKSLYDEIAGFCELNSITDVNGFINKTLNKGFDMEKYGESFALLFNKSSEDIIHIKPKKEEPKPEPAAEVKPEETKVEPAAEVKAEEKKEDAKEEDKKAE